MKSYAATEITQAQRLTIPSGRQLPRAPVQGELYNLEIDWPTEYNPLLPWYPKGAYVFRGTEWVRLSDMPRDRKAGIIGAQEIENERPIKMGTLPTLTTGTQLTSVTVRPTFPKATFSGTASMWVDGRNAGHVWVAIFRGGRNAALVGLSSTYVAAPGQPANLVLTFFDTPNSDTTQTYSLCVYSDIKEAFFINRSLRYLFDGMSQSALIVAENT